MAKNTGGTHDAFNFGAQGKKPAGGTPTKLSFAPGGKGIRKVEGGGLKKGK